MRFREFRNQVTYHDYTAHCYVEHNDNPVSWEVEGVSGIQHSSMYDLETPNFKARSKAGEVILSPMFKSDFNSTMAPALVDYVLHHSAESGSNRYNTDFPIFPSTANSSLPANHVNFGDIFDSNWDDRNEAITQAWANVDESEIQLLASVGELPETIRWIAAIFRRSISVIRLFNRKISVFQALYRAAKKTSKREYADGISALWLEYRYAFRPLVFEMKQAVDAAHKTIKKNSRATGRGFKFVNDVSSSSYETSDQYGRSKALWNRTSRTGTNYRAGVLYRIEDDLRSILASWGIDQPLETAWELMPFSFIIDWFFNIGDLIAMWTDNTGLLPLGSWVTEIRTLSYSDIAVTASRGSVPSQYTWVTSPSLAANGSQTSVGIYKRRIINPPQSYVPSVRLNLDLAKIFDLATIARTLFNSGGRVRIGGSNVR
jgi:hypothetical protein